MQGIKHYMLDIIEPNDSFSVVQFKTLCQKYIKEISKKAKLPIIVGGSGLYLDSILFDYSFRSQKGPDITGMTNGQKLALAEKLYPIELERIDLKNIRRVEQLITRGPSKTDDRNALKLPCKIIGLKPDKLLLKQNITFRTEQMLNKGFVQEVTKLRKIYGADCASLNTTGYAEVGRFLDGKLTQDELAGAIVNSTLKLAKKQATWFKRNPYIEWAATEQAAERIAKDYLKGSLVE